MKKVKALSKINPVFLNGIAHRGLHNEKFTENGLKAFQNAIDHGVAFEFDIHLTKDNELVVCHDENLVRTTGKEGIIEDLTLSEIKANYRLLDGGEIPTLQEVIDLNNEQVPMVIELKVFRKNYKEIAGIFKKYLEKIRDKSNVLIISFDPRSLWPLKRLGIVRSLLIAKSHLYVYKYFRYTIETIDIEQVLLEDKKIQKYCHKHFTNVWTIQTEEELNKVLPHVDTVTFQHMDEKLVVETLQKKRGLLN